MAGHTENSIEIQAPRSFVFERTNDLASWTELFTEYARVDIIQQQENHFVFRLTTHKDETGKVWSWTSWRRIYPDEWRIEAARIEPLTPFAAMNIRWFYDEQGAGTLMRWEQDFSVAPSAPFSEDDAVAYINRNSKLQMAVIKERLEQAWHQHAQKEELINER
jgi:aromatase